jgi:hypothetical protein
LARAKLRLAQQSQAVAQLSHAERTAAHFAEMGAKIEFDMSPARGTERVARAVQWLDELATGGDLTTISISVRSTLGGDDINGVAILTLPSWNGVGWQSAADIRRVLMLDLESRGLMEMFELATGAK